METSFLGNAWQHTSARRSKARLRVGGAQPTVPAHATHPITLQKPRWRQRRAFVRIPGQASLVYHCVDECGIHEWPHVEGTTEHNAYSTKSSSTHRSSRRVKNSHCYDYVPLPTLRHAEIRSCRIAALVVHSHAGHDKMFRCKAVQNTASFVLPASFIVQTALTNRREQRSFTHKAQKVVWPYPHARTTLATTIRAADSRKQIPLSFDR